MTWSSIMSTKGWKTRFRQRFKKYLILSFLLMLANDVLQLIYGRDVKYGWDMIYLYPIFGIFAGVCCTAFFSLFEKDFL